MPIFLSSPAFTKNGEVFSVSKFIELVDDPLLRLLTDAGAVLQRSLVAPLRRDILTTIEQLTVAAVTKSFPRSDVSYEMVRETFRSEFEESPLFAAALTVLAEDSLNTTELRNQSNDL